MAVHEFLNENKINQMNEGIATDIVSPLHVNISTKICCWCNLVVYNISSILRKQVRVTYALSSSEIEKRQEEADNRPRNKN